MRYGWWAKEPLDPAQLYHIAIHTMAPMLVVEHILRYDEANHDFLEPLKPLLPITLGTDKDDLEITDHNENCYEMISQFEASERMKNQVVAQETMYKI